MKTKPQGYYVGTVDERNGEQEYTHRIVFRADSDDHATEVLDSIASGWYNDPSEPDGTSYDFDGGALNVQAKGWETVSQRTYSTLKRYLSELSPPQFQLTRDDDDSDSEDFDDLAEAYKARGKKKRSV